MRTLKQKTVLLEPSSKKSGTFIIYGLILLFNFLAVGVICEENGDGDGGDSEEVNFLSIVPVSRNRVYQRALGKSSVFTCTANVPSPDMLSDFRWWWPDGRAIESSNSSEGYYDETRVEIMRDQPGSLTLLFTSIQEQDLGTYRCSATYANAQQLKTDFTLRAFVPITFEDAPINQYAVKGSDYRVRCRVRADPEPHVDWKKDHRVINNSDHFVMHKDGVIIRGVKSEDEGIWTCRVRVTSMGTVEERHIQVEVHERPQLTSEPELIEGVESETVTLQCSASGKPPPEYEWVNEKQQDLRVLERHTVFKYNGTLRIDGLQKEDAGRYTCFARNMAGFVTVQSTLSVVTKPVIEEFGNITTQVNANAELTCRASGDPAPDIRFHKESNREPFPVGPQYDPRIFIDHVKEGRVTTATIKITDVLRTDDDLYKCTAYNRRSQTERMGHITVEFSPTFINTPMREAWSWDGRTVNLTCRAEAIPNATISWFIEGSPEIKVDQYTPHMKQIGSQSKSSLEIHPIDIHLYGYYKCVATNKLGTAEHRIQLREARRPGPILEAIVHEKTATSIAFKIVGPVEDGGIPIKTFAVQYKKDGESWADTQIKTWPVDRQIFVVEGLEPQHTYHVRFTAENEVGLGDWALERTEVTPRRSAPDVPVILNEVNEVAITAYPDRFRLLWKIPPDNGEKIEGFEISYIPVRNLTVRKPTHFDMEWDPIGQRMVEEKPFGEPRHMLRNLVPDTYYRVEIRAKNVIGLSAPDTIVFKTASLPGDAWRPLRSPVTSSDSGPTSQFLFTTLLLSLLPIFLHSFS